MITTRHLRLEFVVHVPEKLSPGVLYISMECAVATHLCCCGCGSEVVTPFTRDGWKITFDGESISLWPSVGNWNLPCRSHYVIDRNHVVELLDRESSGQRAGNRPSLPSLADPAARAKARRKKSGWWATLKRTFTHRNS